MCVFLFGGCRGQLQDVIFKFNLSRFSDYALLQIVPCFRPLKKEGSLKIENLPADMLLCAGQECNFWVCPKVHRRGALLPQKDRQIRAFFVCTLGGELIGRCRVS